MTRRRITGFAGWAVWGMLVLFCPGVTQASAPKPVTSHPALDYFPAPSRDGRYVAFVSMRSGNADIWLRSLSVGSVSLPRQLTTHPAEDRDPALNADGSQLLYVSHKTDPRGDIYLMDVASGNETKLTNLSSGDTLPQWGPQADRLYYLKLNPQTGRRAIIQRSLSDGQEQEVVPNVSTFFISSKGRLVYSREGNLYIRPALDAEEEFPLTSNRGMDVSPVLTPNGLLIFTRYQEDSNRDGVISTDDQSSIWMGQVSQDSRQLETLYRLTPTGNFHLYPAETHGVAYFTDLQKADIFGLDLTAFLKDYASFDRAYERATFHLDRGQTALGLLGLTNISRNLAPELLITQRAEFDFSYVEQLVAAGYLDEAEHVLRRYQGQGGTIGALAQLQSIALRLHQQVDRVSTAELTRLIKEHVNELMAIGQAHRAQEQVYGQALIEAGRAYLLAGDFLSALDYLVKVDELEDRHIKAKALFTRGTVYRGLGDESSLLQVFVDVITMFGENSSWGRRAVTQAIAVSEQGRDVHQQVASLQRLIDASPDLPLLKGATSLRIAELYEAQGEQLKAIEVLDRMLSQPPPFPEIVEQGYRRKAEILSSAERYEEAAEAYAALAERTGGNQEEVEQAKRLLVLQLVRKAVKNRSIGEVRIAAKEFRQIAETYPESVEAHREYIATKAMLKERDEVQTRYAALVKQFPDQAIYRYGLGLALSYSDPPDFPAVIENIEEAITLNPGISYFHQTLGWAFEQEERINGKSGFLEKAEQEYRIALNLNDGFQFPDVESNLLLNLGNVYMALRNYHEAYRHYQQRDQFRLVKNDSVTELLFLKNFGEAAFKTGHSEEAIDHYQSALKRVPDDQPLLKAELLERIGLAHQDLGQFSKAVRSYSEAMKINLASGHRENLALLQRNIGVNLYNLSTAGNGTARAPLKQALTSYFASLDAIKQFGGKQQQEGTGLINVEVPLGGGGSDAASGFDRVGEEKLMFSYIAGTYEKLEEPEPARDYYLKKLALINASADAETNAARLTEKAVVLNRIGWLSHQLGLPDEALDYMRQSLGYTRTLNLDFGTRVNGYNLSRLFAERLMAGQDIDWVLVEELVDLLNEQLAAGNNDSHTFYTLTNVAFLLSTLPHDMFTSTDKMEDDVARIHSTYTLYTHAWSYYDQARKMLKVGDLLPDESKTAMLLMLDLNMRDLAHHRYQEEAVAPLNVQLSQLTTQTRTWNSWLWHLAQTDEATTPESREALLSRALDELLRYPPQVMPRWAIRPMLPFVDRLAAQYVDLLVDQAQYEKAFLVTEQIAMRKMSLLLYQAAGDTLFLKGTGDYAPDLRALLADMRQALQQEQWDQLDGLSAEMEEILFALYEEYPWAVSYLWQYPLTQEALSAVFTPAHPYIHVVPGLEGLHALIHTGDTVRYVPVNGNTGDMQRILGTSASPYIAIPDSLTDHFGDILPPVNTITRVSSSYDAINGFHQRNLLYAKVNVAGDFALPQHLTAGNVQISIQAFQGDPEKDAGLLKTTDVLIAAAGQKGLSLAVNEHLRVREFISASDVAGYPHHSALIVNRQDESGLPTPVLVEALLRAGFPHVIVNHGEYQKAASEQFATQYLVLLEDLPPHEAVAEANKALQTPGTTGGKDFVLYGYAGMNEEEKTDFAQSIYEEQLNQAVAHYQEQRFANALRHIVNALSVIGYADKLQDENELIKLAVDASYQIGDYTTAVFYQEQRLNRLGESASIEEKSEALYQLGILYSRLEQFDLSIQHLEQAIALWSQAEELDRLAEGIATLGVVRENMGAYSEALQDFGRSFALYEEIGEIGDVAMQHRRIGRIYYLRLGRYEQARKNFEAALRAFQELEDRRGEAETLYEIGLTYEKMGLFEKADSYYQQGRQIGESLDDPFLMASGDLYFANTAWFRGNYQEAFQFLTRADGLARKAEDTQLSIMVKNTRGLMYWTLNDPEKGLLHLQQAVALAREADIKTELASSLNNLGLIYRQQGEYATSLEYFEQAKAIDEELNSRWGLGYDYRNIGMSQLKMGNVVEAEANFIKAEETSAAIKNAINWVKALLELGNVNRTLGKPDKAGDYFTQAYERAKQYGIKEVEWRAAKGKAGLLWEQGQTRDAFTWYADAVTLVEGMRASLKIDELRNSFQANKQDLYRETIRLLIEMGQTEEAFNYLERSRSRSFIDLLGNQKLTLSNKADQEALDTISQLSRQVDALKTELGSYDEPPADLAAQYQTTKARYDEAILTLKQQNPGLSSFVSVDPLTLADVRHLLDPGVALLSFMLTEQVSYAWVIQQTGMSFQTLPVGEKDISRLVNQYRQAVQHLEPVEDELTALYDYLIAPVRSQLEQVEYLGIIPDGPLHFLSFSALKKSQRYLVEEFPLFYTPSASVLKFTFAKRQQRKSTKVLAVGNPDLGNFNYDLPLAELEAKSIQWNYPDMDILTGSKATKEWFIEHINEYGIIHLAAHGEFDEFNPLFSSLWLASDSPSNRRLTVKEVFGLEINADLVTLSACQTGLGKLEAGELIGLNRAFIYAGTHALVSALWRVDDLSTSVLMKHFYRNYVTMDKARSLRQAQLLVKRNFPHPSYWAGFSLVGDYR